MITKYTALEEILDVRSSSDRLTYEYGDAVESGLNKFAALDEGVREKDGYLYVKARAISSRVNKNNDGWPSSELKDAYSTFLGRPVFVDHNNDDPKRTRGVIVSSQLHEDESEKTSALDPYYSTAPDNHKPPTWIELLIEVDSETFPRLAKSIKSGDIDAVSMGANIDRSVCSVCANEATTPQEYCSHIKQKGLTFEITSDKGEKIRKKAYEDCYGVNFFEISFVFDPADATALITDKVGKVEQGIIRLPDTGRQLQEGFLTHVASAFRKQAFMDPRQLIEPIGAPPENKDSPANYTPQSEMVTAPQKVDTLRDENVCPICHASSMEADPDGVPRCPICGHVNPAKPLNDPDLSVAQDTDLRQNVTDQTDTAGDPEIQVDDGANDTRGVTFEPVAPVAAIKAITANGVMSDMFDVKLQTTSKAEADKLVPVEAGKFETTLGTQHGIHVGVYEAIAKAGLNAKVTYTELPDSPVNVPTDNPIMNFLMAQDSAMKGKTPVEDVKIVIEADSQAEAEKIAELIRSSELPSRNAAKRPILPNTRQPSDVPKETVTGDQLQPVESATKIGDTVTIDGTRYVLAPLPSEDDDKADDLVDEVVKADDEKKEEPKSEVKEEDEDKKEEDTEEEKESRLLQSFKIADEFVELGLLSADDKMAFIADIENESVEALVAREKTLASVKQAGYTRKVTQKIPGTKRLPRLAHHVSSNGTTDSIPDEAIFL